MRALTLAALLLCSGCFKPWDVGGPWACTDGGCAEGYTCDDQVCCKPGGTPACPTLPEPNGSCRDPQATKVVFYRDADQDRAGDPRVKREFCSAPLREAWVATPNDCDDTTAAIGPLASERCNAKDDDCDGEVDEGLVRQPWFRDDDHDGFGADCTNCFLACTQPDGYAARGGDCDDLHPDVHPGAPERCNDVDDNCNGRKDDPPFIDTETPGVPGPKFECDAGLPGDCHQGSMQCVWSSMDQRFFATCVAPLPTTDVCGDGRDNDCSGVVDDRPGCGGPATLAPTLGYGAVVFGPDAGLPTLPALAPRCLKNFSGGQPMAWLNPSWISNGVGLHVWYAEAGPGLWWDLSTATSIRLPLAMSAVGTVATGDAWPTPGHFVSPVIQLCGDDDTVFQRYTPTLPQSALFQSASTTPVLKTLTIPLRPGADGGWTTLNANFNLAHVKRIEILAGPEPVPSVTFTNRFITTDGVIFFE